MGCDQNVLRDRARVIAEILWIASDDPVAFAALDGLGDDLSAQRANGLRSMVNRIQSEAKMRVMA